MTKERISNVSAIEEMRPGYIATDQQKAFGTELLKWRLRTGKTQADAGKVLGCSRYTVMRAEAGKKITWESLYKLAVNLSKAMSAEVSTENNC